MEIKTIYVADDGTEFDTEKESYEYEHRYDDIVNSGVVFFDSKHNRMPTDDIIYCAERCLGLYGQPKKVRNSFTNFLEKLGTKALGRIIVQLLT